MTLFPGLLTKAEVEALRVGKPISKGIPTPVAKVERKKLKAAKEADFRKGVWARDKSRSRASGKPLARSGSDFEKVGEVHHVIPRSLAPERVYDVANGLLLSKHEHHLAETICPNAPDKMLLTISGPDDRGQKQTFTWYDVQGKVTKTRIA